MGSVKAVFGFLSAIAITLALQVPATAARADWRVRYEQGLAAAKRGNWDKAIDDLNATYAETGANPAVIFNLALASAKRGDVIPAAAWFRVYLVMVPGAGNALAVRKEIARLDGEIQKGVTELLERSMAAANQLPAVSENGLSTPKKVSAFKSIAYWAAGVSNDDIARRANQYAKSTAEALHYETFSAVNLEGKALDVLDDAFDVIGIRQSRTKYKDEEKYYGELAKALAGISRFFPEKAIKYVDEIPEKYWSYRKSDIIDLILNFPHEASFKKHADSLWSKDSLYHYANKAEELLFAGQIDEAKNIARRVFKIDTKNATALAILGNAKAALQSIRELRMNPFAPYHHWVAGARTAGILLMLGDRGGIRRAIAYGETLDKQLKKPGLSDFTQFSRVYLDLADRKYGQAIKRLKAIKVDDFIVYYVEQTAEKSARYLIFKGEFDRAHSLITEMIRARDRPKLMREMAAVAAKKKDTAAAARYEAEAAQIEMETRGGWKPKSVQHLTRAENWQRAAKALADDYGISAGNLKTATKKAMVPSKFRSDTEAEQIVSNLYMTAGNWGIAALKLKAFEKIDPESVTWQ